MLRHFAKIFYLYDPEDKSTCPYFHEFVNGEKNAVYRARCDGFTYLLKPEKLSVHAPKPGIVRMKRIDVTRAYPRKDISIGLINLPKDKPEPPKETAPAPPPLPTLPSNFFGEPTSGTQIPINV